MTNSTASYDLRTNDKGLKAVQIPSWSQTGLTVQRVLAAFGHRQVSVVVKQTEAQSVKKPSLGLKRCSDPEYSRLKPPQKNFTNRFIRGLMIGFLAGGLTL